MNIEELQTWEIMVPYKMGRKNVPVPYHQEWDEKVRSITGGLTIHKVAKGQWVSPSGKVHKELMIPVRIACTEDQIKQIMAITAEHYKQEAVYAALVSQKTLILHRDVERECIMTVKDFILNKNWAITGREVKRLLMQGAVFVNGERVEEAEHPLQPADQVSVGRHKVATV